jgi:hypothetical protein
MKTVIGLRREIKVGRVIPNAPFKIIELLPAAG